MGVDGRVFGLFDELGVIGCHDLARQPQDYPKNSGLILMSTMVCGSGNCKRPRGPWAIDVVAGRMRCDRWSQHNAQLGIDRVATRLAVAGSPPLHAWCNVITSPPGDVLSILVPRRSAMPAKV